MKIDQRKESVKSEVDRQSEAALSRRAALLRFSGICSIGYGFVLGIAEKAARDRSVSLGERARPVSVDEIVTGPYGPFPYRQVVCTGLAKNWALVEVTTWVGGSRITSGAVPTGSVKAAQWLPTYTLYGSTSDTEITLFRDSDGYQGMFSSLMTTDVEKKLQNGNEVLVKVSGVLTIRDGKQCLMFRSIEEVTPGKED